MDLLVKTVDFSAETGHQVVPEDVQYEPKDLLVEYGIAAIVLCLIGMIDLDQMIEPSKVDEVRSPGVNKGDQFFIVSGQERMEVLILLDVVAFHQVLNDLEGVKELVRRLQVKKVIPVLLFS